MPVMSSIMSGWQEVGRKRPDVQKKTKDMQQLRRGWFRFTLCITLFHLALIFSALLSDGNIELPGSKWKEMGEKMKCVTHTDLDVVHRQQMFPARVCWPAEMGRSRRRTRWSLWPRSCWPSLRTELQAALCDDRWEPLHQRRILST